MRPNYGAAFGVGAIAGLVTAVTATVLAGATGGVPKLSVTGQGASIEPVFAIPASALWIVVFVTAALAGVVLAIITLAVARVLDPEANSVSAWIITPIAGLVGGLLALAVFPLGVTAFGSVQDGTATVSISEMLLLASVVGIAAGAVICWQSYVMARPPQAVEDPELLSAGPAPSSI